jgi:hypothetical protein
MLWLCSRTNAQCNHVRRQLRCEYRKPERARHSHASLRSEQPVANNRTTSNIINFSSVLFLDPSILRHGQLELPDAAFTVPAHVRQMLGDEDEVQLTTAKYFKYIHHWLPFISKKRLYEVHVPLFHSTRPEIVLLLLCIKLSITTPPSDPRAPQTPLYHTAKQFLLELEHSSELSLPALQSMVLLGVYEIGHAIYPAAFLTIGTCARYANALGIGAGKPSQSRMVITLVEIEERRRVWWAIVILDRFVMCILCKKVAIDD